MTMTTQELQDRLTVRWNGYGSYRVTIYYRNKRYTCNSHNSMAYDAMRGSNNGYTYKQALQSFFDECKMLNDL